MKRPIRKEHPFPEAYITTLEAYCNQLETKLKNISFQPPVSKAVCEHCDDPIEHPLCKTCEMQLKMPDDEY